MRECESNSTVAVRDCVANVPRGQESRAKPRGEEDEALRQLGGMTATSGRPQASLTNCAGAAASMAGACIRTERDDLLNREIAA